MKKLLLFKNQEFKTILLLGLLFLFSNNSWGQTPPTATDVATNGDYRTAKTSGNWDDVDMWQVRNGVSWTVTSTPPGAANTIYIQSGHNVVVNVATVNCYSLHINTSGVLTIGTNIVNVNGKIRCFTGAAEITSADGSYLGSDSTNTASTMITTSGSGVLKFVGDNRDITFLGEWAPSGTNNAAEFALNSSQTGILNVGVKFKPINFSGGTITTSDFISASTGDATIKNGGRLISSRSAVAVIGNSSSLVCGTVTIEAGGILELTGSAPLMNCTTFINNGTVNYSKAGTQTLLASGSTTYTTPGTTTFNYSTLILSGTSAKTLSNNTTIANNGILSLQGTATLVGSGVVYYGTNATLEYLRTNSTTVGIEWPETNGPSNFKFKQSTNVSFNNASSTPIQRTVTGSFSIEFTSSTASFTVDDNSGGGSGPANTPNVLTFANGSSIIRTLGTMATSGGTYVFGSIPSDVVNVTIAGTSLSSSNELVANPTGKVNLTINNGSTYSLSGGRIVNNVVNNGVIVLAPTTTLTFTINGSISGLGTISGHPSASLAFTGVYNGNAGTLNFTTGSQVVNNFTVAIAGTNSSVTLGTPVVTSGIGTTVSGSPLTTGAALILTSGTLIGSNNLTLGNGANISRSAGNLDAAPTFGSSVNVNYNGTTANTASYEIPTDISKLNDLTVNNMAGVTFNSDVKVNGVLALTAGTLIIGSDKKLTLVNTPTITSGTIDASNINNLTNTGATVIFANSSPITLPSIALFTGNVQNLTINGSSSVTLGSATSLAGKLNITSGSLNSNSYLTLKSTECCTAAVSQILSTDTNPIIGNITVERFIPSGKRAFRLLSPAVTTTTFISGNWQQQTHITGGASGGFDVTETNYPSMFTYNNQVASGSGWEAITNTNATNLTAGVGYRMLVRGDRTTTNITAATTDNMNAAITLSATGTLKTGTVTLNASSTPAINNQTNATTADYSLVGNPYQSAVDWNAVTKSGIDATYYAWDPNMGTSGVQRGRYVSYNVSSGNSVLDGPGSSNVGQFIQPGQAFFVKNTVSGTAGTLTFQEAHKASTNANVFRTATTPTLAVALYDPNELALGGYPIDATKAVFSSDYSNELGLGDATKLEAAGENIAWFRNNTKLAIDAAAPVTTSDELVMKTLRLGANKNYTFKIQTTNFDTALTPYLVDNFLNTQTEIATSQVFLASFATTSNATSYSENRFKVVFSASSTLSNDQWDAKTLHIYPNPVVDNQFTIGVSSSITDKVTITIYNIIGQSVYQVSATPINNTIQVQPNVELKAGVYMVEMTHNGQTNTQKIIVK